VSQDSTLVRANCSHKSFVPIEVAESPAAFRARVARENPVMDNRTRVVLAGATTRATDTEAATGRQMLTHVRRRHQLRPKTVGADKGYAKRSYLQSLRRLFGEGLSRVAQPPNSLFIPGFSTPC
jgi:hypothetical protein